MFNGSVRFSNMFDFPGLSLGLSTILGDDFNYWVTTRDDFSIINGGHLQFDSNLENRLIGIIQVYKNK
jgi:hypothetical protein